MHCTAHTHTWFLQIAISPFVLCCIDLFIKTTEWLSMLYYACCVNVWLRLIVDGQLIILLLLLLSLLLIYFILLGRVDCFVLFTTTKKPTVDDYWLILIVDLFFLRLLISFDHIYHVVSNAICLLNTQNGRQCRLNEWGWWQETTASNGLRRSIAQIDMASSFNMYTLCPWWCIEDH